MKTKQNGMLYDCVDCDKTFEWDAYRPGANICKNCVKTRKEKRRDEHGYWCYGCNKSITHHEYYSSMGKCPICTEKWLSPYSISDI